jgi:IclR family acetate operon transcriptional repressor
MQNLRMSPTSADRVLELLTLLRSRGKLRVRDATLALDMAPSSAHRLLTTLVRHGFARCDVRHEYFPGPALDGDASPHSRQGRALDRLSSPLLATAAAISQNLGP